MSVPEGRRYKGRMEVFVKAQFLASHTAKILKNPKVFDPTIDEELIREDVAKKLGEIGFMLHREKTRIIPLREGVMFLGFRFRLTETGKVILLIDSDRVAAERRKLKRMARLVKDGKMTREKADECYRSWKAHAENGNSWKLIRKMDRYYMSLWEDGV